MDIKVNHEALVDALSYTRGIIEKRQVMAILSHVLLHANEGKLWLTATDIEVGVKLSIPATVDEPGVASIEAAKLYEFARNVNREIRIKHSGRNISVLSGGAKYTIATLQPEELAKFPAFPSYSGVMACFLASSLKDMIDRVVFCASTDMIDQNVTGVFIQPGDGNKLRMAATDRRRLAVDEQDVGNSGISSEGVVVPRKGIMELRRLVDKQDDDALVSLGFDDHCAYAKRGDITLFMTLLKGGYPNFFSAIPSKSPVEVEIARDEYLQALRRIVGLMAVPPELRVVKHDVNPGMLTMTVDGDFGSAIEEVEVGYAGEQSVIGYNAHHLIDALEVLGEKVTLGINGAQGPGVLRSEATPGYVHLVMPMMVK